MLSQAMVFLGIRESRESILKAQVGPLLRRLLSVELPLSSVGTDSLFLSLISILFLFCPIGFISQ